MFGLSLKLAIQSILNKPFSRLFVVTTVAFILLVGSLTWLLMQSFENALVDVKAAYVVTAYFDNGVSTEREQELASLARKIEGVTGVQVVSKESFLENFSKFFPQLSKELNAIDNDAVPRFLKVKTSEASSARISEELKKLPGIESVEPHAKRFSDLIQALTTLKRFAVMLLLGSLAALMSLLFNHFKIDSLHRLQIISTMKLLGAGKSETVLPFIFEGVIEGLFGGAIAVLLLRSSVQVFNVEVARFFTVLGYKFHESSVALVSVAIVLVSILSAVVGSLWATGIAAREKREFRFKRMFRRAA